MGVTPGEFSNIAKAQVQVKLKTGKVQTYSHGDNAGASLWTRAPYCESFIGRHNVILEIATVCVPVPRAPLKAPVAKEPKILSAEDKMVIKDKATDVATTFRRAGFNVNDALYGVKSPADIFDGGLSSIIDDIAKVPDSLVSSSEANRRLIARWSGSSQCDEALTMKNLSGVKTTFVKKVGYGDDDPNVLGLIKDKLAESTKTIIEKYGMTEAQLKRILSVQTEYTKQFLTAMGQETVTVYRGVKNAYAGTQKLVKVIEAPEAIKVEVNSLSSWSLGRTDALDFAGDKGYLLKYNATLDDIFASPMSTEKELILRTSGPIEVLVQSASKAY